PNPAKDQTTLRLQSQTGTSIKGVIATPSGRIVERLSFVVESDLPLSYDLPLTNWASGVYLITLQAEKDGRMQRKTIKMVVVN
ncbi:T9SS type A sorting domain-containing protein, partial [Arthrospira platensis SPKY1]|nr:T9SS type A sorting domain-containing protein [Arthrospira platensis SPKY1]